ncbi:hypothetical protein [uncultured Lamprocystis sp.]|uniref:fibronectin type III domain-containing protein n=1 Tax=uncultured Lamprocystis sp. TaxID=543132 RepID=UPI0025E450EA|nr:hypothetical protein [uncultured Lamprocystis sp.]
MASDLPTAPTGLTASNAAPGSTGSQITLSWTDNATNDACFDIWRYDVVAAGVPPVTAFACQLGNPDTTGPTTGQTNWIDTAAAANTCYDYQVRAQNNNGDVSTWTQLARGCTLAATGTLDLAATAASSFRVDLTWSGLGTPTVTSFRVIRDGAVLKTVNATASTTYTDADTTAQPDTTYAYTVEAMNGGTVVASGSSTVTTPAAVPAAPTNIIATVNGPTQVTVTWTDGNPSDIQDGYVIERASVTNGAVGAFLPLMLQGPSFTQTSYVDTEVLPGTVYQYQVKAIRLQVGDSPWAFSGQVATALAPMTSVTIAFDALPAGPFTTNASTADTGIVVSWADTLNEGGYEVQRCVGNTTAAQCGVTGVLWATIGTVGPNVVSYANGGVAPGTYNVWYRVRATKEEFAPTAWLNSVPATLNVPAIPGKPTFSTVWASNDPTQGLPRVTVSWSNVANDSGYVLERSADGGGTWTFVANRTASQISFIDSAATGLAPGTHRYRVTAVGNGGWRTSALSPSVVLIPPAQPTINSVLPSGNATQRRTRLAVRFTVASPASGWQLERSRGGVGTWIAVTSGTTTGTIVYTNTGLTAGATYDYRVRTYTNGGFSAWSDVVSGTTAP